MIRRLLVANRGEVARRIFATCRAVGVETVAVYSDADASSPHVREADYAVHLPGNASSATYLRGDLIVAAARKTGADAIHPGYGFLAESPDFATAVVDAGLTWVGPPAKAMAVVGSKLDAKAVAAEAGVPVLPSWTEPELVTDFPVLVKAATGAGGRALRIARGYEELDAAVASARREGSAAFADGTVFCEPYLEGARHIEVEVFADTHGNIVTFGERESSIQRRHQKIVEECPSPAVSPQLREALCRSAVAVAQGLAYVGAGSVEFLLDPDGDFWFLEMSPRLQVEHSVTECVVGFDLVRLQLLVAEGSPLPATSPPPLRGHAIEVRLYAEDPAYAWLPSTGTLHRFQVPEVARSFGPLLAPGLRMDAGVEDGSVVGTYYDPMLAKLVAWAPTRHEAARLLASTLARSRLHGVVTNRDLLVRVLRHRAFLAGETDTGFLERHPEVYAPLLSSVDGVRLSCLAAALAGVATRRRAAGRWAGLPPAWRNNLSAPQSTVFEGPAGAIEVRYQLDRSGALAAWSVRPVDLAADDLAIADRGGPGAEDHPPVALVSMTPVQVVLDVSGIRLTFAVDAVADVSYVDSSEGAVTLTEVPRFPLPSTDDLEGSLVAPVPGSVGRVTVTPGQRVAAGDLLLTLEAMKHEHPVQSPAAGVVTELHVVPGTQVEAGAVLAIVTPD